MKKAFLTIAFALAPACAFAWMGFDSATSELVEVKAEGGVPSRGQTIVVHDIAQNTNVTCLVRDVYRNSQTVELTVSTSSGDNRILVMEGR